MLQGADKSFARPDWKNNWNVAIFCPTQRSLLPQRPGWTDNLPNFFWVACKSQRLVAIAGFIPGRAKDLSAPRYFTCVYAWTPFGMKISSFLVTELMRFSLTALISDL